MNIMEKLIVSLYLNPKTTLAAIVAVELSVLGVFSYFGIL